MGQAAKETLSPANMSNCCLCIRICCTDGKFITMSVSFAGV